MIQGFFGEKGELLFEIDLIAADGSIISVNALLDTGFTEWLAMDTQDVESLGWSYLDKQEMRTARGDTRFNVYQGTVIFDRQELTIPVLCRREVPEILMGLLWLETRRLVVDRKAGVLRLEED
ncbi:MAG: aspartyl protease [Symploca sp. SIO1C2]|nr:aspartyl protease [Symploca sp. SIO1C2]